ncbi:reverse transcriptase [Gigaspora margarita]|uniref:Reverse transcriptase n=1 Tax=Gigaspora margarita TaxID=4874 RepID=A0A8H3X3X8_GIGMA|nr:reverse transcriptase [Gigaspora margarita]
MSINLTLNCFVVGDNPHENTFPIVFNIKDVNTIGLLRELIKEKQPQTFAKVDSRELKLWKVNIPFNELNTVDIKKFRALKNYHPWMKFRKTSPINLPEKIYTSSYNKEQTGRILRAQTNTNVNEDNRCESGYSIVTVSIQSMISTTTSMPRLSMFSSIYESIKGYLKPAKDDNPEGQFKKDETENLDEIKNLMMSDCQPVANVNGTNLCKTRFAIVNYSQQYMINTSTKR